MRSRFAFCLVALFLPSGLFAQTLADHVPADASLYVGWRGTDDPGAGYAQSHLKALADEANVAQLLHETIPQLIDKYGNVDPQVNQVLALLTSVGGPLCRHPSALYVGKVSAANGQLQPPHAVLLCQAGADAGALQTALESQVQNSPVPLPLTVVTLQDVVALTFGFGNNAFALPAPGESLAADASFKKAMAEVAPDPTLAAYVNVESLVQAGDQYAAQTTDEQTKQNWPKVRDAIGLNGLKQIAWSNGFDGRDWGTRAFVAAPAPRTGALAGLDAPPLPEALFATVPRSATLAGAGRFDLAKFVASLKSGIASFNPDMGQQVDSVMQMVSGMVGVDIEKELLPTLGDEWAYYTDPVTSGKGMGGITIINHLRDPQNAQAVFEKFEAGLQQLAAQQLQNKNITIAFRKTHIGQIEMNYLAVPLVTPSWTIQDGYLCIGLYPQVVASAAEHIAAKGKSILDNPAFVDMRTRLGGQSASAIQFMDLQATAPDAYASWRAILSLDQIADVFGVDAPPAMMPPLNDLMTELSAAGQISWTDDRGWHARGISPFPGSSLLATDPSSMSVGQESLLVSILLPALNRSREQANRVKSASNLRQIGQGALLYANDHKGNYPATLGEMLKNEDLTTNVFINPRATTAPPPPGLSPEQEAQWVNDHSDYVWLGNGKKDSGPADAVVAYEKFEGLQDGINILYGDGHVEFQTMAQAHQLIDNAQQSNPNLPKDGGL